MKFLKRKPMTIIEYTNKLYKGINISKLIENCDSLDEVAIVVGKAVRRKRRYKQMIGTVIILIIVALIIGWLLHKYLEWSGW